MRQERQKNVRIDILKSIQFKALIFMKNCVIDEIVCLFTYFEVIYK